MASSVPTLPPLKAKPATKRKVEVKDLETRYRAIIEVEQNPGVTKSSIAKKYGVPPNTLSTWLKNKDKYKSSFETSTFGPKSKRMRTAKYEDLEQAVDIWFREARAANIPISGPIIMAKADQLAEKMGYQDFECNSGWVDRFKNRHGYHFRAIIGESKSVDPDKVDQWKKTTLPTLLADYSADDIYNADETGLFWKLIPNRSMVTGDDDCRGLKKSKDRVTVLPCANMSGTDKRDLLVIGKAKQPHAFRGVKVLPTIWKWNKNAWMTGDLFTDWLRDFNRDMRLKNRKIVLVIDNCRAHPTVEDLSNIRIVWLPPNTTSITQPMDQGIIQNLKTFYRKRFVQDGMLRCLEEKKSFSWSILDALSALHWAWTQVKAKTIANCFRHCGFILPEPQAALPPSDEEEDDEEDDIPLATLARQLKTAGYSAEEDDLHLWLDVDDQEPAFATATDEDIIQEVTARTTIDVDQEEADPEEDVTPDEPLPPPTFREAKEAVELLNRFLLSRMDHRAELACLHPVETLVNRHRNREMKQATIKDFFTV